MFLTHRKRADYWGKTRKKKGTKEALKVLCLI